MAQAVSETEQCADTPMTRRAWAEEIVAGILAEETMAKRYQAAKEYLEPGSGREPFFNPLAAFNELKLTFEVRMLMEMVRTPEGGIDEERSVTKVTYRENDPLTNRPDLTTQRTFRIVGKTTTEVAGRG